MIIKDITIKNFRSYYGVNHFSLSQGLTLIIGDNGDGKTTFFEALEWLFDTSIENKKLSHISEKRKSELEISESDEVSVCITFEHDGEKEIEKGFIFEKVSEDDIRIRDYRFEGYSINGSERNKMRGEALLNMCFEPIIRKYCLFKGENELNVFDNDTALKTLVDTFSGIKQFDDFVEMTANFEQKSANAANRELTNDKKVSKQANELNYKLNNIEREINEIKKEIDNKKNSISDFSEKLEHLQNNAEIAENYQKINERVKILRDKRSKLKAQTICNYSTNLLDRHWILCSFPSIINEFSTKVSALSKEKRKLEKEEIVRIAKEETQKEEIEKLRKFVPLPWNLPDEATMKEMLNDEVCKVCGRPAPKGSEAYEFMQNKLQEYLNHIENKVSNESEKQAVLFPNSFIGDLHNRLIRLSGDEQQNIAQIKNDINDELFFISKRKAELSKCEDDLKEAEDELNDLIIQSGLSADLLETNFSDLRGFFEAKGRAENRLEHLTTTLQFKEKERNEILEQINQLEPGSSWSKVYKRVHVTFEKIAKAFANAKEKNINQFLQLLEEEANDYLAKLNRNDFHGIIRIIKTYNNSARIELHSDNGLRIENPNGALKTTMYMSVLFAISRITTLKREQDYPLIFDAPTSSFGGFKEDTFYNVIDNIDKQCIIVTKDLINVDKNTGNKSLDFETIDKLTCSVYRIEKVTPFDDKDLSTIQTSAKKIK